jgi:MscS family membrane protein
VHKTLALLAITATLYGQKPSPEPGDPLGRQTPQSAMIHFLEACHARDYIKAAKYLDLRKVALADRAATGQDAARQLEDLLDDTPFDIATLSREPEGDESDGLAGAYEHLDTFRVDGQTLDLQLEREQLRPGLNVWLVSAASVALVPEAHKLVAETPFEKKLPQVLVTFEILDTPVWRWIALVLLGAAIWWVSSWVTLAFVSIGRRLVSMAQWRGPLRLCLAATCFRGALNFAPPSTLPRLFIERGVELIFWLGVAWAAAAAIDLIAERWHSRLDPRVQSVSFSVLPLGRQILKLSLFMVAVLGVLSAWGYNTSTILAGLGVGGLAVALAAQKTIENLFGGISVIGDRPVLVGDVCRFGDRTGTVMHIGLRSTRIRTPERTVVSVPNAQFSAMTLENISGRDKIWFHPTLNLRRDTNSTQMSEVLKAFQKILSENPKIEAGKLPVRFVSVGAYSLDIEVNAYVATSDYDEFLKVQQDLLLKMLRAVEAAGTGLAVPLQETVERPNAAVA